MTTTFEKFPNGWYQNYCTRPSVDVEIISPAPVCRGYDEPCGKEITYTPHPKGPGFGMGKWSHVDGTEGHYVSRTSTCYFCGNNDPATVRYVQQSWSDQVECDRCGGSHGYAIGD